MGVRWEHLLLLGFASAQYCDSTLQQRCPDGMMCTVANADCRLGPKLCICLVGSTKAQEEWCDSVDGTQRCLDGTLCSPEFLECPTPRHCSCWKKIADPKTLGEFCDSTLGNQRCRDGTTCDAAHLDCSIPQKCVCGTKPRALQSVDPSREYCDSTTSQRCKDGTVCTASLSCITPQKCLCGASTTGDRALGLASVSTLEFCNSMTPNSKCKDGTLCTSQFLDCIPDPQRCLCGSMPNRLMGHMMMGMEENHAQEPAVELCDSTLGTQSCKDGTPCTRQFLDCSNPMACRCNVKNSAGGELCDSTINQRCKDGTLCSAEVLVCTNPKSCRCGTTQTSPARNLGGSSVSRTMMELCNPTVNQRCKDNTICSAQTMQCSSPTSCLCGSQKINALPIPQARSTGGAVEYCDPTLGDTCKDGTPCSSQTLACSSPVSCICGSSKASGVPGVSARVADVPVVNQPAAGQGEWSDWIAVRKDPSQEIKPKVEYCDSTLPQRCKDGTLCSPQLLDCTTKGPKRCICSQNDGQQSQGDAQRGVLPSQTTASQVGFDLRRLNQGQSSSVASSAAPIYCNSLAFPTERCKDTNRTLCSPLYVDCTTKGPAQCICGSGVSPAAQITSDTNMDNKGWYGAGLYCMGKSLHYCNANQQCSLAEQCVNGCFNAPVSLPDYCISDQSTSVQLGRSLTAKPGVKYCDSLADPPQRCRDATPCSPQYLDCTTKGPRRCICEADEQGISALRRSANTPQPVQTAVGGAMTYVGDKWNGAGLYCNERTSDLLYCNVNAECRLAEHCQRGCFASSGVMDYCIKGTDYLGGVIIPPRSSLGN